MISNNDLARKKKTTKRWIWTATLFYLIIFPFLLYVSLFSVAILDPSGIRFFQWVFILLCLSMPLSIPCSVFCMWRQYFRKNYSQANFLIVLPMIIAISCYFLINFCGSLAAYEEVGLKCQPLESEKPRLTPRQDADRELPIHL